MHRLLRRIRRRPPPLTVTLYTRAGCHLCDDARKPVARAVAATAGATLRIVDIAGQPALEGRFGLRIPVVTVSTEDEEAVIAEGKISDLRLRRALSARGGES
ncbi:MAG: glutaredoxin family protein [Thermomicrobia bacterium]|nr:glutaredoxin family protein [Thermomicrobia bacterium]MCA1724691.1 glutaredoxin family protein [Thermomicrobia bacterium]